jgi:hypothetical protein
MNRFSFSERETRTISTYGEALLGGFLCAKDVAALWALLAWLYARLVTPFRGLSLRPIAGAASAMAGCVVSVFVLSAAILAAATSR